MYPLIVSAPIATQPMMRGFVLLVVLRHHLQHDAHVTVSTPTPSHSHQIHI